MCPSLSMTGWSSVVWTSAEVPIAIKLSWPPAQPLSSTHFPLGFGVSFAVRPAHTTANQRAFSELTASLSFDADD